MSLRVNLNHLSYRNRICVSPPSRVASVLLSSNKITPIPASASKRLISSTTTPTTSLPKQSSHPTTSSVSSRPSQVRSFVTTATTMASSNEDGKKITNWVHPNDKSGEFKRQQSSFRNWISNEAGAQFPAEAGRYHLYVSYACPWATRTLIAGKLKGLESIITFSSVHWHMGSQGWRFVTPSDDDAAGENVLPASEVGIDEHKAFTHLREVYFQVNPDYSGRFTVPVLYDKVSHTIVNNESSEILRMLNTQFNHLIEDPRKKALDLYPEDLSKEIDEANEWHYDLINNGVYKSGFATTQEAYERNVIALFKALDRVEEHLASSAGPFWFGDRLTEVDIRLFVTIIRFDPVYVQHFKCNIRDIRSGYPAIHKWMRELYWGSEELGKNGVGLGGQDVGRAFRETANFLHMKRHYTRSHTQINPFSITPLGPVPDILPLGEEVPAAGGTK